MSYNQKRVMGNDNESIASLTKRLGVAKKSAQEARSSSEIGESINQIRELAEKLLTQSKNLPIEQKIAVHGVVKGIPQLLKKLHSNKEDLELQERFDKLKGTSIEPVEVLWERFREAQRIANNSKTIPAKEKALTQLCAAFHPVNDRMLKSSGDEKAALFLKVNSASKFIKEYETSLMRLKKSYPEKKEGISAVARPESAESSPPIQSPDVVKRGASSTHPKTESVKNESVLAQLSTALTTIARGIIQMAKLFTFGGKKEEPPSPIAAKTSTYSDSYRQLEKLSANYHQQALEQRVHAKEAVHQRVKNDPVARNCLQKAHLFDQQAYLYERLYKINQQQRKNLAQVNQLVAREDKIEQQESRSHYGLRR